MGSPARPPYLDALADFVVDTRLADLPQAVVDRGRWIVADCVPVMAIGMRTPEMQALAARQLAQAGPGHAWVLGTGQRANPLDAALLNGTAGTCLELDEGNLHVGGGHPGIQVVPAALAAAQAHACSGADLLLAAILGYEVCARIVRGAVLRPSVHSHGTYGVIGAAIAVAKLEGCTRVQVRELLNVAATMGMATSRQSLLEGSTVRNIYTGHAGYMGQMAVRLVDSGFTGEVDGVGSVFGRVLSDRFDRDRVVERLGIDWVLMQNYFKLHPTGRYVHSAIDALEDALAGTPQGRIDVASIERIDVRAYRLAAMLNGKSITTSFGARFSIPFALATLLHHGHAGLRAFDEDAVANATVQRLAARIDVRHEPAFDETYPNEQRCELRVTLRDGRSIDGRCVITKGEPDKPHGETALRAKFDALGNEVWPPATTARLAQDLAALADIEDLRGWSAGYAL
ncbi:MAG: MmgE/PrpD family protein [Lautropia sp.]